MKAMEGQFSSSASEWEVVNHLKLLFVSQSSLWEISRRSSWKIASKLIEACKRKFDIVILVHLLLFFHFEKVVIGIWLAVLHSFEDSACFKVSICCSKRGRDAVEVESKGDSWCWQNNASSQPSGPLCCTRLIQNTVFGRFLMTLHFCHNRLNVEHSLTTIPRWAQLHAPSGGRPQQSTREITHLRSACPCAEDESPVWCDEKIGRKECPRPVGSSSKVHSQWTL